jgi:Major tropism determinant N-terminal domain
MPVSTQIQFRRDTAANWTSNNHTLNQGELGIETDTKKFKIGDGSTAWNSLAYVSTVEVAGNMRFDTLIYGNCSTSGTYSYNYVVEGDTTLSFVVNGVTYSTPAWSTSCGCQCPCTCQCTCPCTCPSASSSGSSGGSGGS